MYKIITYLVILSSIAGGIGYEYYKLNNEIDELKDEISIIKTKYNNVSLSRELAKINNDRLKESIKYQNKNIELQAANYEKLRKKWLKKKNQPDIIRYKTIYKVVYKDINTTKLSNGECLEGIKLNQAISRLKYKDL